MALQVVRITEPHTHACSTYVEQHPRSTFFHTQLWREAVVEAFGHQDCSLAAFRDGRVVGVLPLMRIASRLAGSLLVSVPYGVYGGAISDDEEASTALLNHARRLADRMHVQWLDVRSIERQWPDLPVLSRYVTFRKQLPDDPDKVLAELPRKARAAARQARERYELQASFDDSELPTLWSLYSQSMRRLASPNYPAAFFQALLARTCPADQADRGPAHLVQVVRYRNQPIAGLLSFIYRGTLLPYFAGCDARYEKYHPNNFLYLTAMEKGVELGCREFDFGRTRVDNRGSYNFKRFQGFEPTPLQYQYYVPRGGRAPDLHPGNPRVQLARRVWPRLPLAVTRPLGAWLAKSIPG
ncbi:MAG TPA: FemAB family PEP-CTERM system-associated protein [Phycisphaerae bacterium]|nr:FemAB family PEP-CTERM system-associated protein [Phycisphaerae bacterium]HOJ75440.1 FemAB family PEP-CTERM system-associated protein [Phycisphaerae bacterium]HOM52240.1 FemAB family PEP-CTERM system-associated protein [Phycisphaerae bacterium]HON65860.1 FemAB family PEP-CTERM system-associated protein [Phycisphaerae bacterium]HOQ84134.1 FemAB family PEP-CTERM system-associated protein [Phycisphaerae bacterium]